MSCSSKVVAFVDDDPGARKAFKRLLSACGYQVLLYESAEAFLACPVSRAVYCLIADIHLGAGMSGVELGETLARAERPPIPIIFMTASGDPTLRERATTLGCVAFLEKPFTPDELNAALLNAGS
jgi:FixJ family two-component response regulator